MMVVWEPVYFFTEPVLIRWPSCIAANVAITLTSAPLYFRSIIVNVNGSTNSSIPVTLFIAVCKTTISFRITYPETRLVALIKAITMIQTISQYGIWMFGISYIRHTATRTKSAAVSSFDPNSLTVPVFLATAPSTMSLTPAIIYRT